MLSKRIYLELISRYFLTFPLLHSAFQIEDREQEKPRPEYIGKLLGIKSLSGQRDKDLLQIVQKAPGDKGDQKSVHTGEGG